MDVMQAANALAARGHDLVRLEIGQPLDPLPDCVARAVSAALRAGPIGYTEALGVPALKAAIAGLYRRRHGVELDPARVAVTAGSSAGFVLAFLAAFEAGARVGLGVPGYPAYPAILSALGITPVPVPLAPAGGYRLGAEEVAGLAGRAEGVVIANPSNPTGTLIDGPGLGAIARAARGAGLALVVDEIYHGLTYDAPAHSILEQTHEAIVVSSFSKYQGLTGWRIGWAIFPERMIRAVECLAQSLYISPPGLSQVAALAALAPEAEAEFDERVRRFRASRDLLLEALRHAGFTEISPAEGAFYIYARIPEEAEDAGAFAQRLMEEGGVAVTPGADFDPVRGSRTVRLSYAGPPERVAEGARRLMRWR
ncbi:MAG: aminotransferase class I/II-fold pyridoxal phosphate-dependent enzyme [Alphaproteobacteria bacterium]|nr:aminotransferase class I/II-fold pyridoxal phosphate-dependent enzyme [Alphaproteobacteria bacterium]